MQTLFWITTIACIVAWMFRMTKGDHFSILSYVVFGIYLPMFLYFANWSALFLIPAQDEFYWIFICFNVLLLLLQFVDPIVKRPDHVSLHSKVGFVPIVVIDVVYVLAVLLENYLGSGSFLPGLSGIDIHTYHAPLIFYITGATYLVLAFNTIFALDGKKLFLLFDVLVVALLFFGKSARMDAFLAIVECVSLVMFLGIPNLSRKASKQTEAPINAVGKRRPRIGSSNGKVKKAIIAGIVCILLVGVVQVAVNIGNDRMNSYGRYDISYGDGIFYTGPELFGDAMSLYYGYFPFSFYNLNNNIAYVGQGGAYVGTNSYRSLYFGVLQFDNFFDLPLNEANDSKVIVTRGATVTTGFWDFYYDYGVLCFVPMAISLLIYLILRRNLAGRLLVSPNVVFAYFYWTPLWFFMSFNDTVWDTCVLINLIFLGLLSKRLFSVSSEGAIDAASSCKIVKRPRGRWLRGNV